MNKMMKIMVAFCAAVMPFAAQAFCPVCTVAVGGLLVIFESLGIPDLIFPGIWGGALTVSLISWTAAYMRKKGVRGMGWYLLNFVGYWAILALAYFLPAGKPIVKFGENLIWGMDQFLLGAILGGVVFFFGGAWYANMKKKNGGRAHFAFEKVVVPVGVVMALTLVFAAIIYWLPKIGIVLY